MFAVKRAFSFLWLVPKQSDCDLLPASICLKSYIFLKRSLMLYDQQRSSSKVAELLPLLWYQWRLAGKEHGLLMLQTGHTHASIFMCILRNFTLEILWIRQNFKNLPLIWKKGCTLTCKCLVLSVYINTISDDWWHMRVLKVILFHKGRLKPLPLVTFLRSNSKTRGRGNN